MHMSIYEMYVLILVDWKKKKKKKRERERDRKKKKNSFAIKEKEELNLKSGEKTLFSNANYNHYLMLWKSNTELVELIV